MRTILHIDMNSFFATVEQQANPRLRGKPIGVTGGDRLTRTVLSTASVEAKRLGIKTGMQIWQAKRICPQLILVVGDSDKYLTCTTKFLNILKDYTPNLEVFSIDEAFLELNSEGWQARGTPIECPQGACDRGHRMGVKPDRTPMLEDPRSIAQEIKSRIRSEIGEWITCSIGISYNKLMAKLASGLQKPDGLVIIKNQEEAVKILDKVDLEEICGIGVRIKKRLFNMGITNFAALRQVPEECLLASFKSYGKILYNMARGIDETPVKPFYEREEVKSVGHRYTIDHDTADMIELKQILLKLSELVAARLRGKKLTGKTIHFWYRAADFSGNSMQHSLGIYTADGLAVFQEGWKIFQEIWQGEKVRMVGIAVSNLKPANPRNQTFLPEENRQEKIIQTLDKVNNKFGDFTLMRGILLQSTPIVRKPNSFLSDRRFKI